MDSDAAQSALMQARSDLQGGRAHSGLARLAKLQQDVAGLPPGLRGEIRYSYAIALAMSSQPRQAIKWFLLLKKEMEADEAVGDLMSIELELSTADQEM